MPERIATDARSEHYVLEFVRRVPARVASYGMDDAALACKVKVRKFQEVVEHDAAPYLF